MAKRRKADPPVTRVGGPPRTQFESIAEHLKHTLQQPGARARVKRVIKKIDAEQRAEGEGGKRAARRGTRKPR
jgi:hypothetical protein